MLEEIADVSAAGGGQRTLAALEKLRELLDVGAIRGNGERRQSLLNLQVVEKRLHDGVAGAGRHATSMRVGGDAAGVTSQILSRQVSKYWLHLLCRSRRAPPVRWRRARPRVCLRA